MRRNLAWPAMFVLSVLGAGGLVFSQAPPPGGDQELGIFDQRLVANDQPADTEEGVQPQGKGPVHEAFASPAVSVPQPGAVIEKPLPQPIEEMPPEQKPDGDNVQWISGYWHFDQDSTDFMWISGIWRQIPPGMEWVPGTWNAVTGGSQYSPGFWRPEEQDNGDMAIVPTPPEPLVTADPPAPDNNSTYVPGSWVYRDTRYVWRPACWVPFRAGWTWVPARYVATGCGYIFCDGYWDYSSFQERGLLFAPVIVSRAVYTRPGWVYRPSFVVHDQCLTSCLFVNSRVGCYTFGDYYDPRYSRQGFVAWSSYRVNRHPEPLFTQYRHVHRNNPAWERNLVALQQARIRNEAPRPPANFHLQANLFKQNKAQANQLALLAPISRVNTKVMPLVQLGKVSALEQQTLAKKQFEASRNRAVIEANLAKNAPPKLGEKVRPITIQAPKMNVVFTPEKIKTIPAPPPGHKGPVVIAAKNPTNPVITNPNPGKDKGPIVVNPPKDKGPIVTPPKDKGPIVVNPPKDKGPIVVNPPKDKGPIVTPPKDKTPPIFNPPKDKAPVVNPPKVVNPPVQPPKVINPPVVNPPKVVNPPVQPPKIVNPPVQPPKVNPPPPKGKGNPKNGARLDPAVSNRATIALHRLDTTFRQPARMARFVATEV